MSAFANLPISRKLTAAFAAVVAVILVSGVIIYSRLGVIEEETNWRVHSHEVLEALGMMMKAMLDQEVGVRGYLVTGDERFLEPYRRGGDASTAVLQQAKKLTADNLAQQRRIDDLNELADEWRGISEREIALMAKPETRGDARAVERSGAGKNAMDRVRAKVDEIDSVERGLLAERYAEQKQAYETAYTVTILGGAASIVVAMLMGFLLTRGITVPIMRMTSAMTTLAKGDTSVEVPGAGRKDEIGAMAAAVEVFRDSIIDRNAAQAELAHTNRIATIGQLTASIAHEVNQPIAAAVTNAHAALRWLGAEPPEMEEARQAVGRIVENGRRADDVIGRIRALIKKAPPRKDRFELNEAVLDVVSLTRSEVLRHGVSLWTVLATGLPALDGDRIQLQQVILNLIVNAIEAMSGIDEEARELRISTERDASGGVLVAVRDSGPGLDPKSEDRVFEAFYTTKPDGMGLGLAICRSIIEAHGGRLWACANEPRGAVFQFTFPPAQNKTVPAECEL